MMRTKRHAFTSGLRIIGLAVGACLATASVAHANSGIQPPQDESARLAELGVDPMTFEIETLPPDTAVRGASDYSAEVSQLVVDPSTGEVQTPAPSSRDLGAVDHSAEVAQISVDAISGAVIAPAPSSSDFGAVDHSALVAMLSVNAATGLVLAAPGFSQDYGALDYSVQVAALAGDPTGANLIATNNSFPLSLIQSAVVPALGLLGLAALASGLLKSGWRNARKELAG